MSVFRRSLLLSGPPTPLCCLRGPLDISRTQQEGGDGHRLSSGVLFSLSTTVDSGILCQFQVDSKVVRKVTYLFYVFSVEVPEDWALPWPQDPRAPREELSPRRILGGKFATLLSLDSKALAWAVLSTRENGLFWQDLISGTPSGQGEGSLVVFPGTGAPTCVGQRGKQV